MNTQGPFKVKNIKKENKKERKNPYTHSKMLNIPTCVSTHPNIQTVFKKKKKSILQKFPCCPSSEESGAAIPRATKKSVKKHGVEQDNDGWNGMRGRLEAAAGSLENGAAGKKRPLRPGQTLCLTRETEVLGCVGTPAHSLHPSPPSIYLHIVHS